MSSNSYSVMKVGSRRATSGGTGVCNQRLADDEPSRLGRDPSHRAQRFSEPSRPDERGPNAGGNIIAVGLECVFRGVGTHNLDLIFQVLRHDLSARSFASGRANVNSEPGDAECRRSQNQGLTVAASKINDAAAIPHPGNAPCM